MMHAPAPARLGARSSRPERTRRGQLGATLLVTLVAVLWFSLCAMAIVRWTAMLLQQDRDLQIRFAALRGLTHALESGRSDAHEPPIHTRDEPPTAAQGPMQGQYRAISASWTDPFGRDRSLVVHTYWFATRRIY